MSYVTGFVLAVSTDRKADVIAHAEEADSCFMEKGALRMIACWGGFEPVVDL